MSRLLPCLFLAAAFAAAPARAALGETLSDLQKRFGRPEPQLQRQKGVELWSIETPQGERLIYTVTFNDKGRSIAEGLKPVRHAVLTENYVHGFVSSQLAMHPDATATRALQPGEKYTFADQTFTCGADERVWVDEPSDFLIVWAKGPAAMVMAVRAEVLRPPAR
jgi:hypothetical protein